MNLCSKQCYDESLDPEKVKGKIVVCLEQIPLGIFEGLQAASAGTAGMILVNNGQIVYDFMAYPHVLPTSHVNYTDGEYVYSYLKHAK